MTRYLRWPLGFLLLLSLAHCTVAGEDQAPTPAPARFTLALTPTRGDELGATAMRGVLHYANYCAACHGPNGIARSERFPTLRGNPFVTADPEGVIHVVLHGRGAMPPFRDRLTDEQIAEVVSFIRTAWSNEADPVSPEQVVPVRNE
ncbi:MAG: cytochrome c [Chloroflexota bacterium]|nr:cytochrome c [Chloroflexota bacterium]